MTSDGELVLCHDAWIGSAEVAAATFRDLPPVMTLGELLDQCRGRVGLMLELKVAGIAERVYEIVQRTEFPDPVVYASFHHDEVRRLRDRDPDASTLALIAGAPVDRSRFVVDAGATHAGIHVDFADTTFVDALHNAGAKVFVYTANEPAEIETLIACGVDGIISDYPDRVPR